MPEETGLFELIHAPSGIVLARKIVRARGFFAQGIGLIGRSELTPDEGLWLEGVCAVHTVAMRFSLDILFLDRQLRTVGWNSDVRPNRLFLGRRAAKSTIELKAGSLKKVPQLALDDPWLLEPAGGS